jgi:hypothetical protein
MACIVVASDFDLAGLFSRGHVNRTSLYWELLMPLIVLCNTNPYFLDLFLNAKAQVSGKQK